MQNTVHKKNVHKKNSELALWEFKAPKQEKNKRKRKSQPAKVRELQSIDIIGSTRHNDDEMSHIIERRKARRRRAYFYRALAFVMLISFIVLACLTVRFIYNFFTKEEELVTIPVINTQPIDETEEPKIEAPEIDVDLLEVNEYSRPATRLNKIKNIFVHYTANPETSAKQNRSYFANLEETHERSASAHFIIGYEGEIIQCIPLDEQAYAVMTRNDDSISIECCYLDEDGKFTQETYDSLIHLLAWLCQEYDLEHEDILRHYDCGGKLCPLYYVEHEDAWTRLLRDVERFN